MKRGTTQLTFDAVVGDGPCVWRCTGCSQTAGVATPAVTSTHALKCGGVVTNLEGAIGRVGGAVGAFNCAAETEAKSSVRHQWLVCGPTWPSLAET